jgi:hypothetical protein
MVEAVMPTRACCSSGFRRLRLRARISDKPGSAANAGKYHLPGACPIPAGKPPRPRRSSMDEMNDEEKKEFRDALPCLLSTKIVPAAVHRRCHGTGAAPHRRLTRRAAFLGIFCRHGPAASKDSLANLLLRAGVKVAADDMPRKVFTAEETKEKPPEAKRRDAQGRRDWRRTSRPRMRPARK